MKQWIFREKVPDDVAVELGDMSEIAKSILYHRGVKTRLAAENFLIRNTAIMWMTRC